MINLEVIVMSEYNDFVFNYNSSSEVVDDNILLECIINCVMKDVDNEDYEDEEMIEEMMRIGGEIYSSKKKVGGKWIFRNIDDDFVEFYVVSVK